MIKLLPRKVKEFSVVIVHDYFKCHMLFWTFQIFNEEKKIHTSLNSKTFFFKEQLQRSN